MGKRGRKSFTDATTFFVTTTVARFADVFTTDKYCDIFIHNIHHYQNRYKFLILGYVIMPSHFHWILDINPALGAISDIMRDIKKYTTWDVMEAMEKDNRDQLMKLFEQASVGYPDQKRKFWMNRFDDEIIRNQEMFRTKLEYIHNNPVKANLVDEAEEYKYSSARNYLLNDQTVLFVETSWY
jgi:putative transposase